MDILGDDYMVRYRPRKCRRLIADTKPRYRAQHTIRGGDAARRYKNWDHGQPIPQSVIVEYPDQLERAFRLGYTTVIAQPMSEEEPSKEYLARIVAVTARFLAMSKADTPQLLQVDEYLDFFHSNGAPRGGGDDIMARAPRAGRERGTASLMGSQRTRGIPTLAMSEMNRLYAFQLDYVPDAKRFQEMGAPEFALPRREHEFRYWAKHCRRDVWGPYHLDDV